MKKSIGLVSISTMLLLLLSSYSVSAQAIDASGKWNMKVETSAGSGTPVFVLKQNGETVTGTYTGQLGEAVVTGSLKEKTIRLEFMAGEYNVVYSGTIEGNTMEGKVAIGDVAQGTFTGTKEGK